MVLLFPKIPAQKIWYTKMTNEELIKRNKHLEAELKEFRDLIGALENVPKDPTKVRILYEFNGTSQSMEFSIKAKSYSAKEIVEDRLEILKNAILTDIGI